VGGKGFGLAQYQFFVIFFLSSKNDTSGLACSAERPLTLLQGTTLRIASYIGFLSILYILFGLNTTLVHVQLKHPDLNLVRTSAILASKQRF
jgi:hypothetical protein